MSWISESHIIVGDDPISIKLKWQARLCIVAIAVGVATVATSLAVWLPGLPR